MWFLKFWQFCLFLLLYLVWVVLWKFYFYNRKVRFSLFSGNFCHLYLFYKIIYSTQVFKYILKEVHKVVSYESFNFLFIYSYLDMLISCLLLFSALSYLFYCSPPQNWLLDLFVSPRFFMIHIFIFYDTYFKISSNNKWGNAIKKDDKRFNFRINKWHVILNI